MLARDPKKFWDIVNAKEDSSISFNDESGQPIPLSECPSVLNNVFSNFFSPACSTNECLSFPQADFIPMLPILIEPAGIVKLIESIKLSSSCGPDNITSKFLKQTKMYSSIFLAHIFQQSLESGSLPTH